MQTDRITNGMFEAWQNMSQRIDRIFGTQRWASDLTLIAIVLGWTIWSSLGSARLWDRDEPRNARCAVEMIQRQDWIVPMFNDQLRTHKPILLYWFEIASYSLLGVNEFAARFPSAICGSLTVLAIYSLARRMVDARFGLWSAIALASSTMFVVASRAATPDAVLICFSTLGIALLAAQIHSSSGVWSKSSGVSDAEPIGGLVKPNFRLGYLGYAALGCAVLAKGPVGLVIPLTVVLTWAFVQRLQQTFKERDRPMISASKMMLHLLWLATHPAVLLERLKQSTRQAFSLAWQTCWDARLPLGLAVVLAISLPWYIWVGIRTDGQWLYGFFVEHNLNRAVSAMEGHSGGIWYYPLALIAGTFPWSLLLIPIVWWAAKMSREDRYAAPIQLGLIWVGVTVAVFSCAGTKLPSYITTCYPGVALLIGSFFAAWQAGELKLSATMNRIAGWVMIFTSVGLAVGIMVAAQWLQMPRLWICSVWPLALLIPAASLIRQARASKSLASDDPSSNRMGASAAWQFAITAPILIGGLMGQGPSKISHYRSDLDELIAVAAADQATNPASVGHWLAVGTIEPSWVFYLGHRITELPTAIVVNSSQLDWKVVATEHLQKLDARLVVNAEDWQSLQDYWASDSTAAGPQTAILIRSNRFLDDTELIVLRRLEIVTIPRLATLPDKL